jgi:hypothetical protein
MKIELAYKPGGMPQILQRDFAPTFSARRGNKQGRDPGNSFGPSVNTGAQ